MRKKRSRHSTNRSSREDSQHRKFLETLICKACPYARQCRNGTCIAQKYRQERMRKLQEFSRDARKRSMSPPAEDVEELSELLKAAAKYLQETVERRESRLEDDQKERPWKEGSPASRTTRKSSGSAGIAGGSFRESFAAPGTLRDGRTEISALYTPSNLRGKHTYTAGMMKKKRSISTSCRFSAAGMS